jgi:hypothetical protein
MATFLLAVSTIRTFYDLYIFISSVQATILQILWTVWCLLFALLAAVSSTSPELPIFTIGSYMLIIHAHRYSTVRLLDP